jgi:hypothetical protein
MSVVLEVERPRRKRHKPTKQRKQTKRVQSAKTVPPSTSDNQVLTLFEWCALNRIGVRTGRRLLATGNGPKVVQLSPHRIGITIRANREWQAARERP